MSEMPELDYDTFTELPGMKFCTNCGDKKELSQFHRDKTRPDGYKDHCAKCRIELSNQLAIASAAPLREMEEQGYAALSAMQHSGGSYNPHISEALEEVLAPFGGMKGFSKWYFANFLAAKPGSAVRERMLLRIADMIDKVTDIKSADIRVDEMEDGDIIRVMQTTLIEYQRKANVGNNAVPTIDGRVIELPSAGTGNG